MYPYLSADLALAHIADLMREAPAQCFRKAARHPLADRIRATVRRATAALRRTTPVTPSCCPA